MGAANGLDAGLRETEVFHLAFSNQITDRSSDVFDRDGRIDAVLIQEIDAIDTKSFQRGLGDLTDVGGTTIQTALLATLVGEAKLGGYHDIVSHGSEGFADDLLVDERAVGLGGVKERH